MSSASKLLTAVGLAAMLVGLAAVYVLAFASNTGRYDEPRGVRLPRGTTFEAALDSLERAGVLGSRQTLQTFGALTGWGAQVKPGHYLIPAGASNWAVLDKIRKGLQDPIRITIPPGTTPERMGRVLRNQLATDSAAVAAALRDPAFADSLGTDVAHLHGRLLAETFEVYWTNDARRAIARIHERYGQFWTDRREAKARALGLRPDEVLTLASIVEWEARDPAEAPRIAGVYLNRLLGRVGPRMRLQADPTVQFALMDRGAPRMRRLLFRDYALAHPYNTYQIDGLPPGPITNPSDATMDAVLDNERHDYLYFVADGTGRHTFSRSGAEHAAAARRWSQFITEQTRIRRQREDSARRAVGSLRSP